jgi:hypothetical protein
MSDGFPFWQISLFAFGGIFNLVVSIMMFYLRSKGGTDKYTKSQLWALSLLAWLFFFNFLITICEVINRSLYNIGYDSKIWPSVSLWNIMTLITAYLMLAFGLVYPRILTRWQQMKILIIGILLLGLIVIAFDIQDTHAELRKYFAGADIISISYAFAVFIPVFIWLSEYTRQPSKEGRMMYTILIWGFLFAIITRNVRQVILVVTSYRSSLHALYIFQLVLIFLVFIKLALGLWKRKKQWSAPEYIHVGMLIASFAMAIIAGYIHPSSIPGSAYVAPGQNVYVSSFMGLTFGWLLVRPALFSYGLLRYRLLGTQVKAENIMAIIGAILGSTLMTLGIMGITGSPGEPAIIGGAIFIGAILFYPFLKLSRRGVTRLLPMSAGAKRVSMRERRNTYLMSLQTAVVRGDIADEEDAAALEELRKALEVTPREHDLLLESIAQHEARRAPKREIEEAYLIFRDGRLLSHYIHTEREIEAGKDKDIVAGMFAAITEYVKEAMARGGGSRASMDTISYGASTLLIEREDNIFLAVVLAGVDDLQLRQAMRDALAEVHEKYGKFLSDEWDGNREALEGIDRHLITFAERVDRWDK